MKKINHKDTKTQRFFYALTSSCRSYYQNFPLKNLQTRLKRVFTTNDFVNFCLYLGVFVVKNLYTIQRATKHGVQS